MPHRSEPDWLGLFTGRSTAGLVLSVATLTLMVVDLVRRPREGLDFWIPVGGIALGLVLAVVLLLRRLRTAAARPAMDASETNRDAKLASLYPEIDRRVGMGPVFRGAILARYPDADVEPVTYPFFHPTTAPLDADFRRGERGASVMIAASERLFFVTLRARHEAVLRLRHPDLAEAAAAAGAWLVETVTVAEWRRRFPHGEATPCAEALDGGWDAYAAARWDAFRDRLLADEALRPILPVFELARKHPVLSASVPVTSHGRFAVYGGDGVTSASVVPVDGSTDRFLATPDLGTTFREVTAAEAVSLMVRDSSDEPVDRAPASIPDRSR